MKLVLEDENAAAFFRALAPRPRKALRTALENLRDDPTGRKHSLDVKELEGDHAQLATTSACSNRPISSWRNRTTRPCDTLRITGNSRIPGIRSYCCGSLSLLHCTSGCCVTTDPRRKTSSPGQKAKAGAVARHNTDSSGCKPRGWYQCARWVDGNATPRKGGHPFQANLGRITNRSSRPAFGGRLTSNR